MPAMHATPTLLVAPGPDPYAVRIERCTLSVRVRVRLHRNRADRRLARGASPDTSVELSSRARVLLGARARHQIARNWRDVIVIARTPAHPFDGRVPIARAAIRGAADLIEELAGQLESSAPLEVAAIARARLLLLDPSSPVFGRREVSLEDELQRVIELLDAEPVIESADPIA